MESVTISSLAMKIYLSTYYKGNIPIITKASVYRDIKQGYYGVLLKYINLMERIYFITM